MSSILLIIIEGVVKKKRKMSITVHMGKGGGREEGRREEGREGEREGRDICLLDQGYFENCAYTCTYVTLEIYVRCYTDAGFSQ